MIRYRNNIIIRKLDRPKKVNLPNGRTFYAKYKRVRISSLPSKVKIKRTYRQRGARVRRQQVRRIRIENLLKKGFNLAKQAARRNLAKMAVKNPPNFYKQGCGKFKNEKTHRALKSHLTNTTVDCGRAHPY